MLCAGSGPEAARRRHVQIWVNIASATTPEAMTKGAASNAKICGQPVAATAVWFLPVAFYDLFEKITLTSGLGNLAPKLGTHFQRRRAEPQPKGSTEIRRVDIS